MLANAETLEACRDELKSALEVWLVFRTERHLPIPGIDGIQLIPEPIDEPFSKNSHEIMMKGTVTVVVPNPHKGDISKGLLATILKKAGISREEWEKP